jgi:predicted HAD superfamily Cof-like phosphohydrolase
MPLINAVFRFNKEVVMIDRPKIKALEGLEQSWLVGVLKEEADELGEAVTVVDQVDALIDSAIFAFGGLYRLGLNESQARDCFMAVMSANFDKKSGQKTGRIYEGVADAVKPEGWVGPEKRIADILNVYKG